MYSTREVCASGTTLLSTAITAPLPGLILRQEVVYSTATNTSYPAKYIAVLPCHPLSFHLSLFLFFTAYLCLFNETRKWCSNAFVSLRYRVISVSSGNGERGWLFVLLVLLFFKRCAKILRRRGIWNDYYVTFYYFLFFYVLFNAYSLPE